MYIVFVCLLLLQNRHCGLPNNNDWNLPRDVFSITCQNLSSRGFFLEGEKNPPLAQKIPHHDYPWHRTGAKLPRVFIRSSELVKLNVPQCQLSDLQKPTRATVYSGDHSIGSVIYCGVTDSSRNCTFACRIFLCY